MAKLERFLGLRSRELKEQLDRTQKLFTHIRRLSPYQEGPIEFCSSNLTVKLLERAQTCSRIRSTCNLLSLKDGEPLDISFPTNEKGGFVGQFSLKKGDQRQVLFRFDPRSFYFQGTEVRINSTTFEVVDSTDSPIRTFAKDPKLLINLFEVMVDTLSKARDKWRESIVQQGLAYSDMLEHMIDVRAPQVVGSLIDAMNRFGLLPNEASVFGKPVKKPEEKPPMIHLLTTVPISEDVASEVDLFDTIDEALEKRSEFRLKNPAGANTEIYEVTLKDLSRECSPEVFTIVLENFHQDEGVDFVERDFTRRLSLKSDENTKFVLAGGMKATLLWKQAYRTLSPFENLKTIGLVSQT